MKCMGGDIQNTDLQSDSNKVAVVRLQYARLQYARMPLYSMPRWSKPWIYFNTTKESGETPTTAL